MVSYIIGLLRAGYIQSSELTAHQLRYEIKGNSMEKVDLLNNGKEQVVGYAWTNSFWETIQGLLLFQPLCLEP